MSAETLTFNDLPEVTAGLRMDVSEIKQMLLVLMARMDKPQKENRHVPMSVSDAAKYLCMPAKTVYSKLEDGTIPGAKPGKRWVLYQDEVDRWLDTTRKTEVPMTAEEQNEAILSSHRRKPKGRNW